MVFPLLLLFTKCSTDFDINADWKDIAVVYGIIDHSDSVQYIKINKAFLGNKDAYIMAQESDSLFYPDTEVFLEPLNDTSHLYDNYGNIERIKLEETLDIQKDSGIFAYDYNKIFYTTETLDPQNNYRLLIKIPGKENISATTSLVDDLNITNPNSSYSKVGFATTTDFLSYKVEWHAHPIGELYGLMLRFHYREITPDDVATDKYIDWYQVTKRKFHDNEKMEMEIDGSAFYSFVASNIDPGIEGTKRKALGIDFIFTVAGKELALYIEVNGPSEGIVQERPSFSNISNGLGVFSSRFTKTVPLVELSSLTENMLSCSDITKHLHFADFNNNYDCQ